MVSFPFGIPKPVGGYVLNLTHRIHGWKEQFCMTLWSPRVRSRSGFPDNRELQSIRPQIPEERTVPLLNPSGEIGSDMTYRSMIMSRDSSMSK